MNNKGFKDFSGNLTKLSNSFKKPSLLMFLALAGLATLSNSIYYGKYYLL
jgi:hypothetical protein